MSTLFSALTEQFRTHGGSLPGASLPRVVEARERALARAAAAGMPTVKLEDWKYTDIRPIRDASYAVSTAAANEEPALPATIELQLPLFTPHLALFIDGRFSRALSTLDTLPDDVSVRPIAQLLQDGSADMVPYLEKHETAFTALNSAFLCDGIYIELAPDTVLDEPIHVVFVNTAEKEARLNTARLIVKGARNSRCTVVESHCGMRGTRGLTNALTEIEAYDGAQLTHHRIQVDEPGTHHIGNVFATSDRDSCIETSSFAFGGGITRIDVNADLLGAGASAILNGLFMVTGNQHVDHHTRIRHQVGLTHSRENYKGIADGNGRGVFNGKIFVAKDAQKIEALQSSKNLLLSDGAEIDTKPELEIYADDVKCAHGATVGQLDEDAYFYLRSRGIDRHTARSILTFAFAADISAGVAIEPLRAWLERLIVERTHATGLNEIVTDE